MPITDARWSGPTTRVIETETGADGLTIADAGVVGELIDNGGAVYNARSAGAVGSGSVDDQPALAALVAAVPARSRLVIPRGTYRLDATWVIDKSLTIDAAEATFVVNHPGHGIVFQRTAGNGSFGGDSVPGESLDLRMGTIRRLSGTQAGQNADSTALKVVNSYWGQIGFREIVGFRRGLWVHSQQTGSTPKGNTGNTYSLGQISCEEGLRLESGTNGWVTDNLFLGGHFSGIQAGAATADNMTSIRLANAGGIGAATASNTFIKPALEGFARHGVVIEGGAARNRFYSVYIEMAHTNKANGQYILNFSGAGFNNEVIGGTSLIQALLDGNVLDAPFASKTRISGTHHLLGTVEYMDGHWMVFGNRAGSTAPNSAEVTYVGPTALVQRFYSGTPVTLPLNGTPRVQLNLSANVPAGAITLSHVPSTGYEVDLTLHRSGNTFYTVDPDFITGIKYGAHPRPHVAPMSSLTYKLWVIPVYDANDVQIGLSVEVVGHRGTVRRHASDSIASAPEYVGQLAAVGGVGYMATGTASAADWKQIT